VHYFTWSLTLSVDPHSPVPIYQQIAGYIRRAVAAGVFRPGEAIPSLRVLAQELIVNPNTVQRAYDELEREGLIEARKGLGMFVAQDGLASAQSQSQAAVLAGFVQTLRAARSAKLPPEQVRALFERAWGQVSEVRNDP
jgi:GntR family transcriptional regulator